MNEANAQQGGLRPAEKKDDAVKILATTIQNRMPAFQAVATKFLTPERLVKLAQVVLAKKPELAQCTTLSVLDCLMTCARLGLEPNEPGGIWLVPFKGVCTPIIDYRGMIDVCRRSGEILAVHADLRCENDQFTYAIDTAGPTMVTLRHVPADGDRGEILGAFFVVKLKGGECQATYLSKHQIEGYKDRSKAAASGRSPWQTDYPAMAIKTACRRGVNLLPKTPEVQALREEMAREDEADNATVPVGEIVHEDTDQAIGRLMAVIGEEDKALSDSVASGFDLQKFGPAKRLQLLTRYHGDPVALVAYLEGLASDGAKKVSGTKEPVATDPEPVVDEPVPVDEPAPAAPKKKAAAKKKRAKKKAKRAAKPEPTAEPTKPKDWGGGSF